MDKTVIPDYRSYVRRDIGVKHENYEFEQNMYNLITSGNIEELERNRLEYSEDNIKEGTEKEVKGLLSDDPLTNEKYHFVIYTSAVARSCIAAGMPQETAFTLSDMYIRKADKCSDPEEVRRLGDKMAAEYCKQMNALNRSLVYSTAVRQTISYICDHLHCRITADELAEHTGYNRSYLSMLFKKETGVTLQDFISIKRIDTAKNMLRLTDYTYSEIASSLAFTTQSYFCRQFKNVTGFTPKEYRMRFSET